MQFFNKKLPAWMLLAALVIVGAGAATGLVLKDQITGTTTIAVSQALYINAVSPTGGDAQLGTVNDNGVEWAAHWEANNGDSLSLTLDLNNYGANTIVAIITMDVPDGLTISETQADTVEIALHTWKVSVPTGGNDLVFTIAIEDAQPTGFYEITGVLVPVNV